MEKMSCKICGNSEFASVFVCTDHFVSGETFEIVECTGCGMRVTKDFPAENRIGRYYEAQDYVSHSDTKKGIVNRLYHVVRSHMLKKKARWVETGAGRTKGRILDVGAGTGYFADTMKKRGWHVEIIEKSPDAREFAKNTFGLEAFDALESYAQTATTAHSTGTLDVITLWHVLEHLEQLNESMRRFHTLLQPSGTLIIAVPNCSSHDARVYGKNWAAYDVPRHLWHFSPKQMQLLANKHGFNIIKTKRMPFDAFYISMMSEKYAGNSLQFLRGMWTGFAGLVLSWFDKSKSSSLVYVLKKE